MLFLTTAITEKKSKEFCELRANSFLPSSSPPVEVFWWIPRKKKSRVRQNFIQALERPREEATFIGGCVWKIRGKSWPEKSFRCGFSSYTLQEYLLWKMLLGNFVLIATLQHTIINCLGLAQACEKRKRKISQACKSNRGVRSWTSAPLFNVYTIYFSWVAQTRPSPKL